MAYEKLTWVNGPDGGTPVSAANLQRIEDGIETVDIQTTANTDDINALQTSSGNWFNKTVADNGTSVASADKVFIDTTGGAFNLVLPASPADGNTVKFVDAKGNFATANFTIAVPAGVKLMGTIDGTLDLVDNYDFVDMTYFAADDNWIITAKP